MENPHIVEAQDLVQRSRLRSRIRDRTQHAQLLLETLAYLEEKERMPPRSKTIKTRYEDVADSHAVDLLITLKSIQNHLSDLHMLGFLRRTDRNRGESGGRYYEYSLDLDLEILRNIRGEIKAERDP